MHLHQCSINIYELAFNIHKIFNNNFHYINLFIVCNYFGKIEFKSNYNIFLRGPAIIWFDGPFAPNIVGPRTSPRVNGSNIFNNFNWKYCQRNMNSNGSKII